MIEEDAAAKSGLFCNRTQKKRCSSTQAYWPDQTTDQDIYPLKGCDIGGGGGGSQSYDTFGDD